MADALQDRFAQFFAETRQSLLGYVRRLGQARDAAEDIVQDAFAKTLEQAHDVQQPKAFAFVTARNLSRDAYRHQRVAATETVGDIEALGGIEHEGASPEEVAIAEEASVLLREAIERLPPQCRAAFALKVFHARSYKDIAEQLGISTKTVEKHIARGLRDTHAFMRRRYQLPDREGEGS